MKLMIHTVATAGLISGRTTMKNLCRKVAPSMAAASSRLMGISVTKFFSTRTVNGMTELIYRMISPR